MQQQLQVTFNNMQPSDAVEKKIRERVEKLDKLFDQILACRVVIEAPHKHQHKGGLYHVSIDLTLPDSELVVNRRPDQHQEHEDIYVAVRDAFNAMRKQLLNYISRRHRQVKSHEVPPHGRISQLYKEKGYGMIEKSDGVEIYFHKNSVLNADFNNLELGSEVRFAEEEGDLGPQASTVKIVGKHHITE
jgi:ribosomal subunit interface protein